MGRRVERGQLSPEASPASCLSMVLGQRIIGVPSASIPELPSVSAWTADNIGHSLQCRIVSLVAVFDGGQRD